MESTPSLPSLPIVLALLPCRCRRPYLFWWLFISRRRVAVTRLAVSNKSCNIQRVHSAAWGRDGGLIAHVVDIYEYRSKIPLCRRLVKTGLWRSNNRRHCCFQLRFEVVFRGRNNPQYPPSPPPSPFPSLDDSLYNSPNPKSRPLGKGGAVAQSTPHFL